MSTLGEAVRGNVASLFGRFRPPQGQTAEAIQSAKAERIEFGDRLIPMLKLLSSEPGRLEKATRSVFRELQGEPASNPMPTPDGIAARVRAMLSMVEDRPDCVACLELGGIPGIFTDSAKGTKVMPGCVPVGKWLCSEHAVPVVWFKNRQERFEDGLPWRYPPPECLLPRSVWGPGVTEDQFWAYTDGPLMDPLTFWIRDFIEDQTGKAILGEPAPIV